MSTTNVVQVAGLNKSYGKTNVLESLDFNIEENTITGLLGRNGAGKTTIMSILAGQEPRSGGRVSVFGADPFENADVLANMCFVRESQKYPEDFKTSHVLKTGPWFFENWDAALADELVEVFRLPVTTRIKKLSRGQLSAVAIIVGMASRAPLTIFDEPYLGLDATARGLFYDYLLRDSMKHPRTILMSTHLIDEVSNLLEKVVVIDRGRKVLDMGVDEARDAAFTVAGGAQAIESVVHDRKVLRTQTLGGLASVTVDGAADADIRARAAAHGVEIGSVGLQDLVSAYGLIDDPAAAAITGAPPARHHAATEEVTR
ncbi:ATP-binding cassette domain-containing protein [Zhihengliuella halotolerans]|uniref:ABC-2 type transport system ATP-binding protein n=1 Tax=Zhihengliuella halotolerans TaxID=370736 RepID=A0A4Q8AGN7_9MICC|nr:ABC transporter ATP-binding protein [Zhihengliuella halotolerans]RZU63454.1 ABC-2 type transport system ATP-binding protein [Zhihengliuella halotolerans]